MKTATLTLLLVLCFFDPIRAQTSNWLWAKGAGGSGIQEEQDAVADKDGNVYITGYYSGSSITFDSATLPNSLSQNVFFLAKYSPAGTLLWARSINPYQSSGCAIATDDNGSVYVSGNFQKDTIAFDNTHVVVNHTYGRSFVVKYDSAGVVRNVFASADNYIYDVNSIASDGRYMYVVGTFLGSSFTLGSQTLSGYAGIRSAFIARYTESGDVSWAQTITPIDSVDLFGTAISVDRSGHLYVAGRYAGSGARSANQTTTSSYAYSVFAAKYDTAGHTIWIKSGGGDFYELPKDITADGLGNVYMTGLYHGDSISFASYTFHSANPSHTLQYSDLFLVKFDSAGNVVNALAGGETGKVDGGYSLAVDDVNDIYLTGGFGSTFHFGSNILTAPAGSEDALFLVIMDSDLHVYCSDVQRSGGDDQSSIALDKNDNVYVGGDFEDSLFAPDGHGLTLVGQENIFVARYSCSGLHVGYRDLSDAPAITVHPNPSSSVFYFEGVKPGDFLDVYDQTGRNITSRKSDEYGSYKVNLGGMAAGLYFYQIRRQNDIHFQGKIRVE